VYNSVYMFNNITLAAFYVYHDEMAYIVKITNQQFSERSVFVCNKINTLSNLEDAALYAWCNEHDVRGLLRNNNIQNTHSNLQLQFSECTLFRSVS
jgi:hypothetical protein